MEVEWLVARTRLYQLRNEHPEWSKRRLAHEVGYSYAWVKKWLKRFAEADEVAPELFQSRSRRPKARQKRVPEAVVRRILEIRDNPPAGLARIPGPVTILYYLHEDEALKQQGVYIPTSSRTIWRILDEHQRIVRPSRPEHKPEDRPAPLTHWQMDFKSISSVPADPEGKRQHVVETLNVVDKGTSILLAGIPRDDYNAETVFDGLVTTLHEHGLPKVITFDCYRR